MIPAASVQTASVPATSRIGAALLSAALLFTIAPAHAQTGTSTAAPAVSSGTTQTSGSAADTQARRRAARRRARAARAAQASQGPATQTSSSQVAPSAAQRERDAQILAAQKAQSARIAQENDATIQSVVRERQQQQAEPRIQDAPGPGSQPLPGDPAVPPTQSAEPPRIQDAPGPAQTLPQAPPAAPPQSAPASPPQS